MKPDDLGTTNSSKLQFPVVMNGTSFGYMNGSTFVAFRGDSTDTYTYDSGSTGGTVDLGARNNYRYVNADNVYTKGKADGGGVATFTYTAYESASVTKPAVGTGTSYGSGSQSNTINFGRTIKTVSVRCTGGSGTVGGQSISSGVTRTFSNISSLSLQVSATAIAYEDVQQSASAAKSMTVVITLA